MGEIEENAIMENIFPIVLNWNFFIKKHFVRYNFVGEKYPLLSLYFCQLTLIFIRQKAVLTRLC